MRDWQQCSCGLAHWHKGETAHVQQFTGVIGDPRDISQLGMLCWRRQSASQSMLTFAM